MNGMFDRVSPQTLRLVALFLALLATVLFFSTQIEGYLNAGNERFTADGWFRTGDRVEQGPDGTLRVLGRIGELINVGGEKLMPAEVESVVLSVPGVTDCRVRGEPNALTGQTVVVDVVAHNLKALKEQM